MEVSYSKLVYIDCLANNYSHGVYIVTTANTLTHCMVNKGTLQVKYKFTSVYRAVHADFSSAVRFLIYVLVYEISLDMLFIA